MRTAEHNNDDDTSSIKMFKHEQSNFENLPLFLVTVLVLAGTELIFFTVASMGLSWICAGNSADNTGVFQLSLSSACTEPRPSLPRTPPHQRAGWGCTRSWEGTQLGQLTPTDQRDVPHHMASHSAYRAGGRRRKWGHIQSDGVCLPK